MKSKPKSERCTQPRHAPESEGENRRSRDAGGTGVPHGRRTLAEVLLASGRVARDQVIAAVEHAERHALPFADALTALGLVSEADCYAAIAKVARMPLVDLSNLPIPDKTVALLPERVARRHTIVPLLVTGPTLVYAVARPYDDSADRDVTFTSGYRGRAVLARRSQIVAALNRCYPEVDETRRMFAAIELETESDSAAAIAKVEQSSAVIDLCNHLLTGAVHAGASDIHIEPGEEGATVRYRIGGILQQVMTLPPHAVPRITNRFKILARMDIAMRHAPQDGAFLTAKDLSIQVRVSSLPTVLGEKLVMRVIDHNERQTLDTLKYEANHLAQFRTALSRPDGLILVTGPTGSGKTTALYAGLHFLANGCRNIVSVEDPVERRIDRVNQIAVNDKRGTGFAAVLRSVLRQDPNVIMVGEIRDPEVARIVGQAAFTGHLVLSSLHTGDSASAVIRLINLGLEPYKVAECLSLVVAQRLIRTLCPVCRVVHDDVEARRLGVAHGVRAIRASAGRGCARCRMTGYMDRVPLVEMLVPDEQLCEKLALGARGPEIRAYMRTAGQRTMSEAGLDMVADGVTSMEEVERVIGVPARQRIAEKTPNTRPHLVSGAAVSSARS